MKTPDNHKVADLFLFSFDSLETTNFTLLTLVPIRKLPFTHSCKV